jgi:hypothetical protein
VLRDRSQSVVAATRSEEDATARDARLREGRHLHIGTTEDGAVSIRGELAPVEGAIVKNALEAVKRRIFDQARREGHRESQPAYMADSLVALCQRGTRAAGSSGTSDRSSTDPEGTTDTSDPIRIGPGTPRAEIVLHVSAEALRRGHLESGEIS